MMRAMPTRIIAALVTIAVFVACDDDSDDVQQDTGPIVGVLELPISHRHADPAPSDAASIEVSPAELRVDGQTVLSLAGGVVPEAEVSGGLIPKLGAALATPVRSTARLRVHVNTPYGTTAAVLATAAQGGLRKVGFEVRGPDGGPNTGWLVLPAYRVEDMSDEPIEFEASAQRQWNEFVTAWEAIKTACRGEHSVDCSPTPFRAAEGGAVQIIFFSRGQALKAEFNRVEPDGEAEAETAAPAEPAMLEGIVAVDPEGEELPPETTGAFTWRFAAATMAQSPITTAFHNMCATRECGIEIHGDPETLTMRFVSFIGAAFPDGALPPQVVFRRPN